MFGRDLELQSKTYYSSKVSVDEHFCYFTKNCYHWKSENQSASNFLGDTLLPIITMQVSSDSVDSLF